MSERGSYVTQFMYRDAKERARIMAAFAATGLNPVSVANDENGIPRIISGYYRRKPGYDGEEIDDFQFEVVPALAKELSKPLRVAILSDSGGSLVFRVWPSGDISTIAPPANRPSLDTTYEED